MFGRATNSSAAARIGMVGAVGLGTYPLHLSSAPAFVLAGFVLTQGWTGWRKAGLLRRRKSVSRPDWTCPPCGGHPPVGPHWFCHTCKGRVNAFGELADSSHCGTCDDLAICLNCGVRAPYGSWASGGFPYMLPQPVLTSSAHPAAVAHISSF